MINRLFEKIKSKEYQILIKCLHLCQKCQIKQNLMNNTKMQTSKITTDLKNIFQNAIISVLPQQLISENVSFRNGENQINICQTWYHIPNGFHLIGFGKAVLGMAIEFEKIAKRHIKGGILSVPVGILSTLNTEQLSYLQNTKLTILEAAKNNLPDTQTISNTQKIIEYIEQLEIDEMLILLISGGGSALLTQPKPPMTLNEKLDIIKHLISCGANINELNSVRKYLSTVKGGGLARIAYPRPIISLILSDVINDPLDIIASGPTVMNMDTASYVEQIFQKYNLMHVFKQNIPFTLSHNETFPHVVNHLIGNNKKALKSAETFANDLGYLTCVLSAQIDGDVKDVSLHYTQLVETIIEFYNNFNDLQTFTSKIHGFIQRFRLTTNIVDDLYKKINNYRCDTVNYNGICLIMGGETTVLVRGKGAGGRNQELALNFSIDSENNLIKQSNLFYIYLLCGGTDGIDGPTDAAGAISYVGQCTMANVQAKLSAKYFLDQNNSYEYYSTLNNGEYLLKIGHTGTNVMDVHLIIISKKI